MYVISVIHYTEFNATYDRELSCSMSGFVDQVKFSFYAANPRTRDQSPTYCLGLWILGLNNI